MNANRKFLIIIVSLLAVLSLLSIINVFLIFFSNSIFAKRVPLSFEGNESNIVWGEYYLSAKRFIPDRSEKCRINEGNVFEVTYSSIFCGCPCQITISFVGFLKQVNSFQCKVLTNYDNKNELFALAVDKYSSWIIKYDNCYFDESAPDVFQFGINLGAEGIAYTIKAEDNCVIIIGDCIF